MFFVIGKHIFFPLSVKLYQWVGRVMLQKSEEIAILIFLYLQFASAIKKRWISDAEDKASKSTSKALAIYSSSDNSFIRTWKEQNRLKMDTRHLLFPMPGLVVSGGKIVEW